MRKTILSILLKKRIPLRLIEKEMLNKPVQLGKNNWIIMSQCISNSIVLIYIVILYYSSGEHKLFAFLKFLSSFSQVVKVVKSTYIT